MNRRRFIQGLIRVAPAALLVPELLLPRDPHRTIFLGPRVPDLSAYLTSPYAWYLKTEPLPDGLITYYRRRLHEDDLRGHELMEEVGWSRLIIKVGPRHAMSVYGSSG